MGEFMKLAGKRQTCRDFADKPVEHDKIAACLEAARLAPSGCNAQPWSFIVVENPELAKICAAAAQQLRSNPYAAGAKAFLIILEEKAVLMPGIRSLLDSQYFAKGDLGAAAAYFQLAAEEQGLGTCQFGLFDRPKLHEALNIPQEKTIAALFGIGYPKSAEIRPKQRKPMAELVKFM